MSDLDDDISRIAALRGRKAADYTNMDWCKPKATRDHVARVFSMSADSAADLDACDRLPQASRDFLREAPIQINSRIWAGLLEAFAEADLIETARSMITWPSIPNSRRSSRRR